MTARNQSEGRSAARTGARRRTAVTGASLVALVGAGIVAVPSLTAAAAPSVDARPAAMLAPYYTELDLTGDAQVTEDDLAELGDHLGVSRPATGTDPEWDAVAVADTDGDGTITVADLAALSQRIIYDDGPFGVSGAGSVPGAGVSRARRDPGTRSTR